MGDRVTITPAENQEAVIEVIHDRRSKISRIAANTKKQSTKDYHQRRKPREQILLANLDKVFIVTAPKSPPFTPGLVDRLLVGAQIQGVEPIILVNKADMDLSEAEPFLQEYERIGYTVIRTCALTGQGLPEVLKAMNGAVSAFIGQSGVGKTTLLNHLLPEQKLRHTQEVSDKTGKGLHTTTCAEIYPLPQGGFLADTPGIREFSLAGIEADELADQFPEMAALLGDCKFTPCTHLHEPGCAIRAARGTRVSQWRYQSFQNLCQSLG